MYVRRKLSSYCQDRYSRKDDRGRELAAKVIWKLQIEKK